MGNVCCGSKEESSKNNSTFLENRNDNNNDWSTVTTTATGNGSDLLLRGGSGMITTQSGDGIVPGGIGNNNIVSSSSTTTTPITSSSSGDGLNSSLTNERTELEIQQEQDLIRETMKGKMIVQAIGRAMVSVNTNTSRDRNTIYYSDQGFAAALAQHLEQKMSKSNTMDHSTTGSNNNNANDTTTSILAATSTNIMLPPIPKLKSSDELPTTDVNEFNNTKNKLTYSILSQPIGWDPMIFHALSTTTTTSSNTSNPNTTTTTTTSTSNNNNSINNSNNNNRTTTSTNMSYLDPLCEQIIDSIVPKKERIFTKSTLPIIENLL
jgi:hypothetical protein